MQYLLQNCTRNVPTTAYVTINNMLGKPLFSNAKNYSFINVPSSTWYEVDLRKLQNLNNP